MSGLQHPMENPTRTRSLRPGDVPMCSPHRPRAADRSSLSTLLTLRGTGTKMGCGLLITTTYRAPPRCSVQSSKTLSLPTPACDLRRQSPPSAPRDGHKLFKHTDDKPQQQPALCLFDLALLCLDPPGGPVCQQARSNPRGDDRLRRRIVRSTLSGKTILSRTGIR